MPDPQEETLGRLTMHSDYSEFTVSCDALAVQQHQILALSVVGAETALKAIRAVLHDKNLRAYFQGEGLFPACNSYTRLARGDWKYEVAATRLGLGTVQMMAVAQAPGLLRAVSDEALWRELRSSSYTTPILRAWVPWLREQLVEQQMLRKADCFGCEVGRLIVTSDKLDELVSWGVKSGELALTKGGHNEHAPE